MSRGLLLAVPFFAGFGGFMFVFAVALQGEPAGARSRRGLRSRRWPASFFVASLLTSRLLRRWGRNVLTAGLALQATGLFVLIATVAADWPGESGRWTSPLGC